MVGADLHRKGTESGSAQKLNEDMACAHSPISNSLLGGAARLTEDE